MYSSRFCAVQALAFPGAWHVRHLYRAAQCPEGDHSRDTGRVELPSALTVSELSGSQVRNRCRWLLSKTMRNIQIVYRSGLLPLLNHEEREDPVLPVSPLQQGFNGRV